MDFRHKLNELLFHQVIVRRLRDATLNALHYTNFAELLLLGYYEVNSDFLVFYKY